MKKNVISSSFVALGSGGFLKFRGTQSLLADTNGVRKITLPYMPFQATRLSGNRLLLLHTNGLAVYDESGKKLDTLRHDHLNPRAVVADSNQNIWVGTVNNGLFKFSFFNNRLSFVDSITKNLPNNYIRSLMVDRRNRLWVGTRYNGVFVLEEKNAKRLIKHFGTAEGLKSIFVISMHEDAAGNIWLGGSEGLDKLIPEGDSYRVFNFGFVHSNSYLVNAIHFLPDGRMICAGYPGAFIAKDDRLDTLPPFPIFITAISSGNEQISPYSSNILQLKYDSAQINFEFTAPGFINENALMYSYRLLGGSDSSWSTPANNHTANFANLGGGQYTFEVRVKGLNDQWGSPATFAFVVQNPFWQTWWFWFILALISAALIYGWYRYRLAQAKKLHKVRSDIAKDLHDDIGSTLTNIGLLSLLARKKLSEQSEADRLLHKIGDEASDVGQSLDDIIWSVNINNDTLYQTLARMRRLASEAADTAGFKATINIENPEEDTEVPMQWRRDIYLIFKELLNNMVKHSGATHVAIDVGLKCGEVTMKFTDNGKGFNTCLEKIEMALPIFALVWLNGKEHFLSTQSPGKALWQK